MTAIFRNLPVSVWLLGLAVTVSAWSGTHTRAPRRPPAVRALEAHGRPAAPSTVAPAFLPR